MTDDEPAVKAARVLVPSGATAGEAFQIAIDACLVHLAPNESCWLSSEHPDCLHQTRVSTRRLRALLSLMRTLVRGDPEIQDLQARLRLILVPLGPARALDVALQRAHEDAWSAADLTRLRDARVRAYARARQVLESSAWQQIWEDLTTWRYAPGWLDHVADLRDGPARVATDAALDHRYRRIVRAGPHLLTMSDFQLHRVRIEGKKLRYGCEFFDTLYDAGEVPGIGPEGETMNVPLHFAETVAGLQDAFGAFNDDAVARELRMSLGLESGDAHEAPTRLDCVAAWQAVVDLDPFWRTT